MKITSGKVIRPQKVVIYGSEGIGKTVVYRILVYLIGNVNKIGFCISAEPEKSVGILSHILSLILCGEDSCHNRRCGLSYSLP